MIHARIKIKKLPSLLFTNFLKFYREHNGFGDKNKSLQALFFNKRKHLFPTFGLVN